MMTKDIKTDLGERLARVQTAMAARGFEGLIAYYGAQHNMLRTDPILMLGDYRVIGPSVLLVPAKGEPSLIVSPQWDLPRAMERVPFTVSAVEENDLAEAAADGAKRLSGRVALIGQEVMAVGFAKDLDKFLPDLEDGGDVLRSTITTRTEVEVERITKAALMADAGFAHLCKVAEVGMYEYELAAEIDTVMQALGSEDNFGLMAAGPHNVAIRAVCDRKLERGDVIVGEITPCNQGYFAQLCRTFILGEPTDLQREKFAMLCQAQNAALAAALPGQPSSGIAKAANAIIGAAGYAEYCRQPYMRTRGHGLGLGGVVPYDVTEDSGPLLAENMTMVIHPNQYIPETGYMMLGDTVVIELAGPRKLTQTEQRLFWRV